nr:hypothetical protein [Tanacetum cinerariifolium]
GKPAPLSSSNLKVAGSNPRLALGVSEVAGTRYGANGRLTRGQKHVIMRFVIRANDWCRGNDWLAEAQYEVGSPRQ